MKKFFVLALCLIINQPANSWDTNISLECINENLEKCSSANIMSTKSNEDSDTKIINPPKKKKKFTKEIDKSEKKEKKAQKKLIKMKKKKVKKRKKNIEKPIKVVNIKKNDSSFEEFKNSVISYSNKSGYPDIDN